MRRLKGEDGELWREEFCKQREHTYAGGFVKFAKPFDEPALIDRSDLIEHDLAGLAFESNGHARGIRAILRRHGGDDHGIDVMVHFIGRDDEAWARLANLASFGGIKADEEDLKARNYHCQSFRSH